VSRIRSSPRAFPWLLLILLWTAAFALGCRLDFAPVTIAPRGESVLGRVLGATRVAFSQRFYMEADRYFHLGVEHTRKTAFQGPFDRWYRIIQPDAHVHPEHGDVNEMLPWLRFATEADPHNVEAYLNAAYWLAGEGRHPELALAVYNEALRNNPDDYRIYLQRAQFFMRQHQYDRATRLLDSAKALWPGRLPVDDEQTRLDLAQILSYRAFLHELNGEQTQALELYKTARTIVPRQRSLQRQIEKIEDGTDMTLIAKETWVDLFPSEHICSREVEGHSHAHDEHGQGEPHHD
jgi:tetratricopeptide (TPR) repeat protein